MPGLVAGSIGASMAEADGSPVARMMPAADILDLVQWPAMAVTVAASWLVASRSGKRRAVGFWVFLASNILWVIWGWHAHAYALIFLQFCLAVMNIRGLYKNDPELQSGKADT